MAAQPLPDPQKLIGPKRLADLLECGVTEAKAILAAIADITLTEGIHRLTAEGYATWIAEKKAERKPPTAVTLEIKSGNAQAGKGTKQSVGSSRDHKWQA